MIVHVYEAEDSVCGDYLKTHEFSFDFYRGTWKRVFSSRDVATGFVCYIVKCFPEIRLEINGKVKTMYECDEILS